MLDHRRESKMFLPHRTHSRTRHACTVRRVPWDACIHGNCRGGTGAKTLSEWGLRGIQMGFSETEPARLWRNQTPVGGSLGSQGPEIQPQVLRLRLAMKLPNSAQDDSLFLMRAFLALH
jgi:hypothetical protein